MNQHLCVLVGIIQYREKGGAGAGGAVCLHSRQGVSSPQQVGRLGWQVGRSGAVVAVEVFPPAPVFSLMPSVLPG